MAKPTAKKSRRLHLKRRSGQDASQRPPVQTWLQRGLVLAAFLVMTAALTREPKRNEDLARDIDLSVARNEVRAAFDFETVDLLRSSEAQEAAAQKVPDYYQVDENRVARQLEILEERIAWIESHRNEVEALAPAALLNSTSAQTEEEALSKAIGALAARIREEAPWEDVPESPVLAVWLTPDLDSLPARQFTQPDPSSQTPEAPRSVVQLVPQEPLPLTFSLGDTLRTITIESVEAVENQGVRPEALPPTAGAQRVVVLRGAPSSEIQATSEMVLNEVPDPVQAVDLLSARLKDAAQEAVRNIGESDGWARLHDAALAVAETVLSYTIRYDKVYTAGARERAREAVPPVMKKLLAGEIIQERAKRWTPQSRSDVKAYLDILKDEEGPTQRVLSSLIAHAILSGLVLLCLSRAVNMRGWSGSETATLYFLIALLLMTGTLIIGRVASYFEPSGFLLPVAAPGILFAILVNVRLGALVGFLIVGMVSAQYGYDWRLMAVGTAMTLGGVFSIVRVRRRSDMAAASLKAALVGLAATVAITLATDSLFSEAAMRRLMLISLNGGICLLAVPGMLSPLERLFGVTTDIQLLEYSDLNNELLSQLAIKAPGTYAHSLMLGQLAEAASDAINANGLLARVCAYYHDIGKMRRSEYFSENQTGENIHDTLSPRLSARAIAAHVLQGADMAREYHLPKPIIDGILEHHGTCLIGYFYQQALDNQKHGDVIERDFRYPGPKPQRPETAILMICDASESGVRSIKNPNEERVRDFVDTIIDKRAEDGQFDDCNLTFRQLNIIAEVVSKRITTSLHTRVAYPAARKEEDEGNIIALSGGSA